MIDDLWLTNFKAFDDVRIPFRELTLLSGLNGTGKSSVLQALGLLRQSFDAGVLATDELILNGPLVEIGTGRDLLFQDRTDPALRIGVNASGESGFGELWWTAEPSPDEDVLNCKEVPSSLAPLMPGLLGVGFQFLRADRITPSVTFPKSQHAIGQRGFLGPRGEYTAHFLQAYGEDLNVAPALIAEGDAAPRLLAQTNAWMQAFSPGVRVTPETVAMTDFVRLAYSYQGEGVAYSDPFRPTNVGFGLTHVLPVIVACLSASPGSLIAIENPEAQLHPRGQAAMGRLLALTASSGVQVVLESHSDHVLNGIRLTVRRRELSPDATHLHFFTRTPGSATSYETPMVSEDGRLSFWPVGFFDQWERSLDELLS